MLLNTALNFPLSSHHSILKALLNTGEGHEMHLSILETVATPSFSKMRSLVYIFAVILLDWFAGYMSLKLKRMFSRSDAINKLIECR